MSAPSNVPAREAEAIAEVGPEVPRGLSERSFWYIACESRELGADNLLARTVLDEDLVLFRDEEGAPIALRDRCMHRAAPLSRGKKVAAPAGHSNKTSKGCIQCPYHGWTYDGRGEVVAVPCEKGGFQIESSRRDEQGRSVVDSGEENPSEASASEGNASEDSHSSGKRGGKARATLKHEVLEQDGLVFVRLRESESPADSGPAELTPFRSPHYGEQGFKTVRLQNLFHNNVTNCAENFIDIPHTVFVHPAIFRDSRDERLSAEIVREAGAVHVTYHGETDNLGWFKWFLNPTGREIEHSDHFYMPNITSVAYTFSPRRRFHITSQSVPITKHRTLVYTDLTFDYGFWNLFAGPLVRWLGQRVIDQDLDILKLQGDSVEKYGDQFAHTSADTIHLFVESIRDALLAGKDPRKLPKKERQITFWI